MGGFALVSAVAATQVGSGATGDGLLPAYHSALWTAVAIAAVALLIAVLVVRPTPTAGVT